MLKTAAQLLEDKERELDHWLRKFIKANGLTDLYESTPSVQYQRDMLHEEIAAGTAAVQGLAQKALQEHARQDLRAAGLDSQLAQVKRTALETAVYDGRCDSKRTKMHAKLAKQVGDVSSSLTPALQADYRAAYEESQSEVHIDQIVRSTDELDARFGDKVDPDLPAILMRRGGAVLHSESTRQGLLEMAGVAAKMQDRRVPAGCTHGSSSGHGCGVGSTYGCGVGSTHGGGVGSTHGGDGSTHGGGGGGFSTHGGGFSTHGGGGSTHGGGGSTHGGGGSTHGGANSGGGGSGSGGSGHGGQLGGAIGAYEGAPPPPPPEDAADAVYFRRPQIGAVANAPGSSSEVARLLERPPVSASAGQDSCLVTTAANTPELSRVNMFASTASQRVAVASDLMPLHGGNLHLPRRSTPRMPNTPRSPRTPRTPRTPHGVVPPSPVDGEAFLLRGPPSRQLSELDIGPRVPQRYGSEAELALAAGYNWPAQTETPRLPALLA